jgi:hypothetical protein
MSDDTYTCATCGGSGECEVAGCRWCYERGAVVNADDDDWDCWRAAEDDDE